ncbi:1,4-dihydroxy-2-naphthoyl-CoA thioesterase 1-like isoform X1 [Cucurbita maxima]|uniref:1,4-dihydroxy-2-naphthoyl-CoA thioesterase 1-like isoform X1 n=1 Tax=Cucurbita maxima TaxID=3661 RepID=A0A6J1IS68_CUCMA|nr:1,4-dihydroxy-2-naphthoyl-CoA thioesterase 1-like isoform X1 [Cucurbita maxima]
MDHQNPNPNDPPLPSSPSSTTAILDSPLNAVGFEIQILSPHRVSGRIVVSPKCCQPFKVLHGGVSAMIAEALASVGAQMAAGFKRVAGFHLSIDHLQSAEIGDLVLAEATPLSLGNTIQVWEVELWKAKSSSVERRDLVASSRVTLLCNMPVPKHAQPLVDTLKRLAKL